MPAADNVAPETVGRGPQDLADPIDDSIRELRKSLICAIRKSGHRAPDVAKKRLELCHKLFERGDFGRARRHLRRAILGLGDCPDAIVEAYSLMGEIENSLALYPVAATSFQRALAALEDSSDLSSRRADLLMRMGECQSNAGDRKEAIETLRLSLNCDPGEPASPFRIKAKRLLANAYQDGGQFEQARSLYSEIESLIKDDLFELSATLNSWAILRDRMGDISGAARLLERSVEFATKLVRRQPTTEARHQLAKTLINYATLFAPIGDAERAGKLLDRAARVLRIAPDVFLSRLIRYAKAEVAHTQGKYARAVRLLRKIIDEIGSSDNPDDVTLIYFQTELAENLWAIGRRDEAISTLRKIARPVPDGPGDLEWILMSTSLAMMLALHGASDDAEKLAREALAFGAVVRMPEGKWRCFLILQDVATSKGRTQAGVLFGKISMNIIQSTADGIADFLPESSNLYREAQAHKHPVQVLLQNLVRSGRLPEAGLVQDMSREQTLFDFVRRDGNLDPRHTMVPLTTMESSVLSRYEDVLDRLKPADGDASATEIATGSNYLEAKLRLSDWVDLVLQEQWVKAGKQGVIVNQDRPAELGIADIRYILSDGEIVISVNTVAGYGTAKVPCSLEELNFLVNTFRQRILSQDWRINETGRKIYDLLLSPIVSLLVDSWMLRFSADGALNYLPFSALFDGSRYVVERWATAIMTAAPLVEREIRDRSTWQVAGFGATKALRGLAALDGVVEELTEIARVAPLRPFIDDQFTSENLIAELRRPVEVVHIATHYIHHAGRAHASHLLLGTGETLSLDEIRSPVFDLSNVELLVLSACDSGTTDIGADGLESFAGLAQMKGARSVVATLWPVADSSAAALVARFYSGVFRKDSALSLAEALRQAQVHGVARGAGPDPGSGGSASRGLGTALVGSTMPHPFHWAGYTLFGDWR